MPDACVRAVRSAEHEGANRCQKPYHSGDAAAGKNRAGEESTAGYFDRSSKMALEMREQELLMAAGGGLVQLDAVIEQMKLMAEGVGKRRGAVTQGGQSAATLRAFRTEGGDDTVTAEREGVSQEIEIGASLRWVAEEMEDGTIVPDVERLWQSG